MANLEVTIANKVNEYKKVDKAIKERTGGKIINKGEKEGVWGEGRGVRGGGFDVKKNQSIQINLEL